MLNMDFTVDLSVWQDGFTFQSEPVQTVKAETPRLANKPSFAQQLKETAVSEPEKTVAAQKPVAARAGTKSAGNTGRFG